MPWGTQFDFCNALSPSCFPFSLSLLVHCQKLIKTKERSLTRHLLAVTTAFEEDASVALTAVQRSSDLVEPRVESESPCAINVQTATVDSHEILFLLIPFVREEHSQFNFGTADPASGEKKQHHINMERNIRWCKWIKWLLLEIKSRFRELAWIWLKERIFRFLFTRNCQIEILLRTEIRNFYCFVGSPNRNGEDIFHFVGSLP